MIADSAIFVIRETERGTYFATYHGERGGFCVDLTGCSAEEAEADFRRRAAVYGWSVAALSHRSADGVWRKV